MCTVQLYLWISSPDATVGHEGVLTKALVMLLIFPLFFSPPPILRRLCSLTLKKLVVLKELDKELNSLSIAVKIQVGGLISCAAGSVAEHLTAECVTAWRFSLYFSLCLALTALCAKLCFVKHNHNIEVEMRHATYPVDWFKKIKISWAAQEPVVSHSHWGAWKAGLALQLLSRSISILKWIGCLRFISNASWCLRACRPSLVLTVLWKSHILIWRLAIEQR